MYSLPKLQSMASKCYSAYASVAMSIMILQQVAHDIIPAPVKSFLYVMFWHFFKYLTDRFFSRFWHSTYVTMVVDERSGVEINQIYEAAEVYLRSKINSDADTMKINKMASQKKITLSMVNDQVIFDSYQGFELKWKFVFDEEKKGEKRYFELTFQKSKKEIVVDEYLPFILARSAEINDKNKAIKLYTRDPDDYDDWKSVDLYHPLTFNKLAMNSALKKAIIDDLDRFLRRKEYYKKVGKAWKRGYLLYGPPGTGKSSLVAAMANYLKFDVYDLELTGSLSNSDLRRILLLTNNKSILVIEDIDCSIQLYDREREKDPDEEEDDDSSKLTLSGLLNVMDGLWSTCGDERIIVFTTNHKDKLDPALLRPGRMDMHIHMGYCTPEGFGVLASNYLGIDDHPMLFPVIKELIRKVEISPAEIAEHLMRSEDVNVALEGVIDLLKKRRIKKMKEIVQK